MPWEDLASRGLVPPGWALAKSLIRANARGAVVPGFAPGTGPGDSSLVLWRRSDGPPRSSQVIDAFGRLPRDDAPWR